MFETIKDINIKYNGEWVFMINCKTDDNANLIGGEVVIHSKSRDEVIRGMLKYKDEPSMTSIRYAGKIPEEVSILL
jgi:hypothetical protein